MVKWPQTPSNDRGSKGHELNQLGLPNVYFQVHKLAVSQLVLWPATPLAMFPVSLGHETHVQESISVEECTHMKGSIPECQPLHFRKTNHTRT